MITCQKTFHNLPFAHRQHTHDGHCRLIHGHNWSFTVVFAADKADSNGFVVDFGKCKWIKQWLERHFDHTLVLNSNDPMLPYLTACLVAGKADGNEVAAMPLAKVVTVSNCGAEGLARLVLEQLGELVAMHVDNAGRGVRVVSVTVHEDDKNAATATEELP